MNTSAIKCSAIAALSCAAFLQTAGERVYAAGRPWAPSDSAAVRYFSFGTREPWSWFTGDPITWQFTPDRQKLGIFYSPDGRYFFTSSFRGDLQRDRMATTVRIFATDAVRAALRKPVPASDGFHGAVASATLYPQREDDTLGTYLATWDQDGRSVLFVASTPSGYQVHRLEIGSTNAQQLTHAEHDVTWFAGRAGMLIYGSQREVTASAKPLRYPMDALVRFSDGSMYRPVNDLRSIQDFFVSVGPQGRPYPIDPVSRVAFSPDGWMVVVGRFVPSGLQFTLLKVSTDRPPEQLLSVPADYIRGMMQQTFWSADGRHVILIGLRLTASFARQSPLAVANTVAVYDVRDGSWQGFEPVRPGESLGSVDWSEQTGLLRLTWKSGRQASYQLRSDTLVAMSDGGIVSGTGSAVDALEVEIRQSENDPPAVVATEANRSRVLSGEDPALRAVHRIPVQRFRWKHFDGQELEGGLLLPRDHRPGRPVPVVIQPYFYLPKLFLPDGVSSTGDAAQALAARGMAVLLMNSPDFVPPRGQRSMPAEGPEFTRGVDTIVDSLVAQGITQAQRVALLGFSRGGYLTHYALTHPARTVIAAAAVNDSFTGSLSTFLDSAASDPTGSTARRYAAVQRSPWEDPVYWWEQDPSLNTDRVRTPVIFSFITRTRDLAGSEPWVQTTIGTYRLNDRPFDYLFLPKGSHELSRPLQRVALMEAMVDWMSFWLLGEENPDPAKAVQNQRWVRLREEWTAEQAREIAHGEPGFIKTRSGLMYAITKREIGQEPRPGDAVKIHYVARGADGAELANTRASGKPVTVRLRNGPIPDVRLFLNESGTPEVEMDGWDEGLRFVHAGEKATLLMRRELAPAGEPARERVPAGAVIRYEVEVISIERASTPTNKQADSKHTPLPAREREAPRSGG